MIRGFILLCTILLFTGCATQTEVNKQIASSNDTRFAAFSKGMAECKEDAACKVGLSMAFAGGLGLQKFEREDSAVDYLKAGLGWFQIGDHMFGRWLDSKKDSTGDGIVLKDLKADSGSTINIGGFNRVRQSSEGDRSPVGATGSPTNLTNPYSYNESGRGDDVTN